MIGRIDIEKTLQVQPNKECLFVSVATVLNHVVDAVNGILDYAPLEMAMKAEPNPAENVQGKFAEQRKWIGCLVRYKICDFQGGWYTDVLDEILDHPIYPFKMRNGETAQVCEVIKPNEIYPNKARTW